MKKTKKVKIGNILIGGGEKIAVQSMTTAYTADVEKTVNKYTKETIYQLRLECNDMNLDVCINKEDLLGEPEVGRRFKGTIWLQGHINFAN